MASPDEIHVRVGTPADVHAVMQLALAGSVENGFVNPDPLKLLGEVWPALNRHYGIMGLIGKPGDGLEGAALLRVCQLWYSHDWVLEERAIFVPAKFRAAKGGRARKLCQFAKEAATGLGIPLMIGVLSNQRTKGKVKLYQREFGEPAGAYWLIGGHTRGLPEAIPEKTAA